MKIIVVEIKINWKTYSYTKLIKLEKIHVSNEKKNVAIDLLESITQKYKTWIKENSLRFVFNGTWKVHGSALLTEIYVIKSTRWNSDSILLNITRSERKIEENECRHIKNKNKITKDK